MDPKILQQRRAYRIEAGRRLQFLRGSARWTQSQLADKSGIPQATVARFEHGHRGMTAEQRSALAAAFGISPNLLDPVSTPEITDESLVEALPDQTGAIRAPPVVSEGRSKLSSKAIPPELESFLAKNQDLPDDVRWHLVENREFRLAPWKKQDEQFWAEMAEFWKRYLREHPPKSGGKG